MKNTNYILEQIEPYLENLEKDNHRYISWEHCYNTFNLIDDVNTLSLQLANYLASWGMYRGSGVLLQKDHTVHNGIIKYLLDSKCSYMDFDNIMSIQKALHKYYECKGISPTDTLLSKIILGTLGIVPAFDTYFNKGYKTKYKEKPYFNLNTINNLNHFIKKYLDELKECQIHIAKTRKMEYPYMKIIDMYYFELGQSKKE